MKTRETILTKATRSAFFPPFDPQYGLVMLTPGVDTTVKFTVPAPDMWTFYGLHVRLLTGGGKTWDQLDRGAHGPRLDACIQIGTIDKPILDWGDRSFSPFIAGPMHFLRVMLRWRDGSPNRAFVLMTGDAELLQ